MERNPKVPTKESSYLTQPLISLTRICCRFPVAVLALSLLVAILSLYWTSEHLGFKMSRLDLINPNSGFNRLWLNYIEEFGDSDEIIVVVEGKGNAEVIPVLDALSDRIERVPKLFQGVLHGVDISKIRAKGLHYVPLKDLQVVNQFVEESTQITNGHWDQIAVDSMLGNMALKLRNTDEPATLIRTLHELDTFSSSLSKAFGANPCYGSPWPEMHGDQNSPQAVVPDVVAACSQNDTIYFLFPTQSGAMGFVLLKLAGVDKTQITQGNDSINQLRSIIASVSDRYPSVRIGLTGMPILENDEMRLSSEAMGKATILALIGVGAVFMAGFGGIRHPLLGMVTLLIAFAWTMGYITLSVGHLNILSISFGAMLIGLGTDFGVHYIARYLELRRSGLHSEEALCQTAGTVGPGILTGAITTALAFYAASLTEFTGISELGTISGGGLMLCVLATFLLLPAMIQLVDGNRPDRSTPAPLDIRQAMLPVFRFPVATLTVVAIVSLFVLAGIPNVWYDHNLLNLQPEGLESVELERRLLNMDVDQGGRNVWFALSIADSKEELLDRKRLFAEKYPELKVEEIVSWFPEADHEKIPILEAMAQQLQDLPERPPNIGIAAPDTVGNALGTLQHILTDPSGPVRRTLQQAGAVDLSRLDPQTTVLENLEKAYPLIVRRLTEVRESIRRISETEFRIRMSQYQSAVAGDLLTRLRTLRAMAITEPPTIDDLPDSLVERFVSRSGKCLMRIYTTANIWDMDEMRRFVKSVRDIDPNATGSPLQTYESSLQMQKGFISAAFYAFGVIVFFLYLDFRNIRDTIISILPMLAGFILMFGLLGWLNIPLNPANMIVLPLILGIGIDDGLHVIHDFRNRRGRYMMSSSTATAVVITSLTTFIGFGSMMIASHRGLQSLGRVLVIGVAACMVMSLLVLPAILVLWTRKETEESSVEPLPQVLNDQRYEEPSVQYVMEESPDAYVFEGYVAEQEMEMGMETKKRPKRLIRRNTA